MAYIGTSPSNGVRRVLTYTATANQTTFTGTSSEGITLTYFDGNYVDVYQNGVLLGTADYTATSGTSIVLVQGASVNDIIVIIVYDVFSVADTVSQSGGGTFEGNVTMAGTLGVTGETTLANNLNMGDADIIKLGASADLQIQHDGTNSYIQDIGTGNLLIEGSQITIRNSNGTEALASFTPDGAVTLYHDNAAKLATSSTGVTVTGTATQATNGSASAPNYAITSGSVGVNGMYVDSANELKFASGGAERLKLSSAGIDVTGTTTTDNLTVEGSGVNFTVNQTANNLTASFIGAGLGTMELQGTSSGGFIDIKQGDNDYDVRIGGNNSGGYIANGSAAFSISGTSGFSLNVSGAVSKSSGSFKINHPLESKKDTHHLFHSFIEGPQCDNLYRGKVALSNGSATINLDTKSNMTEGTFVALNRDVQCFTTNETGWTAIKGSVSGNVLTITAQDNTCTDTISWLVIAERKDDEIKASSLTDDDGNLVVEKLKSEAPDANQNYGNVE